MGAIQPNCHQMTTQIHPRKSLHEWQFWSCISFVQVMQSYRGLLHGKMWNDVRGLETKSPAIFVDNHMEIPLLFARVADANAHAL